MWFYWAWQIDFSWFHFQQWRKEGRGCGRPAWKVQIFFSLCQTCVLHEFSSFLSYLILLASLMAACLFFASLRIRETAGLGNELGETRGVPFADPSFPLSHSCSSRSASPPVLYRSQSIVFFYLYKKIMGAPVVPRTCVASWAPSGNGADTGLNGRGRRMTNRALNGPMRTAEAGQCCLRGWK